MKSTLRIGFANCTDRVVPLRQSNRLRNHGSLASWKNCWPIVRATFDPQRRLYMPLLLAIRRLIRLGLSSSWLGLAMALAVISATLEIMPAKTLPPGYYWKYTNSGQRLKCSRSYGEEFCESAGPNGEVCVKNSYGYMQCYGKGRVIRPNG